MTYEHDLAFNLRLRGLSEREITEVIDELQAHTAAGRSAETEFGTPEEYAAQFPATKSKSTGKNIVVVALVLAVVYVIATFAAKPLFDLDVRNLTGPATLWPALLLIALGLIAGFLVDYLRPAPVSKRDR